MDRSTRALIQDYSRVARPWVRKIAELCSGVDGYYILPHRKFISVDTTNFIHDLVNEAIDAGDVSVDSDDTYLIRCGISPVRVTSNGKFYYNKRTGDCILITDTDTYKWHKKIAWG